LLDNLEIKGILAKNMLSPEAKRQQGEREDISWAFDEELADAKLEAIEKRMTQIEKEVRGFANCLHNKEWCQLRTEMNSLRAFAKNLD
jgi:hypothetical protein